MTSHARGTDTASNDRPPYVEPELTENARKVLEARYLKKNEAGECVEAPAAVFRRVAHHIADVETQYGASEAEVLDWELVFYELMTSGEFMPNSPTLMNAGREMGMLSACFVLPVRDSITEIFNSIKHTALIQKAGGGTGFAFDELRPTGDFIKSSGGTTSGPISFWKAFSEATNAIQQGAFRRGANMGMMYIHHPDILKFLHAKQDLNQFNNYNISVKMTDAWMQDLIEDPDSPHVVRNPRGGKAYVLRRDLDIWKYDIRDLDEVACVEPVSESDGTAYFTSPRLVDAIPPDLRGKVYTKRDVWDYIVKHAWETGEPGVVFMDRIAEHNPTPQVGRIEATNPCGEQPLLPYEACNLGSINLGRFVRDAFTPEADVDWDSLRRVVHLSTRFLDDVIDANNYPLPEIANICKANRKIGLGIMGFADALYMLGVAYNSAEGVEWGERFMRFVNDESHNYSEDLARSRGCFPNWQGSIWQTKHSRLMRNATTTTVAPTGTISIIANCSGGIEPLFSLAFERNVLRGQKHGDKPLIEVNEAFREVAERRGLPTEELFEHAAREGTLHHLDEVPEDIKRVFVCAHDIAPDWHVRMQAAFQRHCDSSISKTINFPNDAATEDVKEIYQLAFELKCKGVTVYRDGCREFQPMALTDGKKQEETVEMSTPEQAVVESEVTEEHPEPVSAAPAPTTAETPSNGNGNGNGHKQPARVVAVEQTLRYTEIPVPSRIEPQDLPEIVSGLRIRQMTPFGNMHVKITVDPRKDRELEVFAQLGKGGDVATSDLEAICRMISLWLRSGGNLRAVIKQLSGIGSSLQIPTRSGRIMSLGDGLAAALKKYTKAKERFGLRSLLLGEIDLSELDNLPRQAPHNSEKPQGDVTLEGDALARAAEQESNPRRIAETGGAPGSNRLAPPQAASESHVAGESCAASEQQQAATVGGESESSDEAGVATAVAECSPATPSVSASRSVDTGAAAGVNAAPSQTITRLATKPASQVVTAPRMRQFDKAAHYKLKCPECGAVLTMQEGCRKCHDCGWSAC